MRLIDAYKFSEKCREIIREENDNPVRITWATAYDNVIDEINEQPTVDAVPVVRCKDCKWQIKKKYWTGEGICLRGWCAALNVLVPTSDNDYCSRGVKKDKTE